MKRVINLDGLWKLQHFDFGVSNGQFREDYDDSWWLDARVPGEVHETLLNYNLIEDPFYGKNCDGREWVERVDWWYRCRFYVPEEFRGGRNLLVFDGLDTFANIWLNGKRLADSEDMFTPLSIDVSEHLKYGEYNVLAVRLGAPWYETIRRAGGFSEKNLLWNGSYVRLYARKAQYQYGWDWAVKLLTVGIWRSVKLISFDKALIRDLYARTLSLSIDENKAKVEICVEIDSRSEVKALLKLCGECGESRFNVETTLDLKEEINSYRFTLDINNPKIWWPIGYGEQNLYTLRSELLIDGAVEDEYCTRFGIRTVELVTESNETSNGKVFYFKINGVKVFCKGANWIPADLLISRINRERYLDLLKLAVDGNHNMLRVWGGGLVEHDDFYDLCDELGIMLWHDFQFACGHYPDDEKFLRTIEKEVEATVRRLRNHPSIILWCGNNENEMFDYLSGFGLTRPKIDFEVIPKVVSRLDESRPYWPSSPWGGSNPNDMMEGDRHNWDVYHGLIPIEGYLNDETRFMSEFGMQAAPDIKTLLKFIPTNNLWPMNDYWLYHYHVPEKVIPYMKDYGEPRFLHEYVFLSMLVQADALKTAIEHCRRRKFGCGGVLYWSFNAPWPNICWETVDYYGRPKMGFYFAKRAFEPVMVSPLYRAGVIEVWVINDELNEIRGILEINVVDLREGVVTKSLKKEFTAPANSSIVLAKYRPEDLGVTDPSRTIIVFDLKVDGKTRRNTLLLTKHRDISFSETLLKLKVLDARREDNDLIVVADVGTDGYARLVNLDVKEDYVTNASDNYFDLLPNETRRVEIKVKNMRDREKELTLTVSALNAKQTTLKVKLCN
ncbi:MAG: glycoside hydrolase family 2 protein [Candidatus Bathyarchaeia archaeon]